MPQILQPLSPIQQQTEMTRMTQRQMDAEERATAFYSLSLFHLRNLSNLSHLRSLLGAETERSISVQ